jgi:hypothetical protein
MALSDDKKVGLMGLAMIGVGCLFFAMVATDVRNHYRAPAWPTATGTVTNASFEKQSWALGLFSESSARVDYDYVVGGQKYSNDTISFLADDITNTSSESGALGAALGYSLFNKVTVHYNPSSPGTSCLVVSGPFRIGSAILSSFGGLLFFSLGLLLAVLAFKKRNASAPQRTSP